MKTILKSTLLISTMLSVVFGQRVKSDKIETFIISLPKVSLKTFNYDGLNIIYAVGDVEILGTTKDINSSICAQKKDNKLVEVNTEYFKVNYKRPPLVIVVKDRGGKVVAAEKIVTDETIQTTYGKGDCRFWFPGVIDTVFTKEKPDFKRTLQETEANELKKMVPAIIDQKLFAGYAEEEFKLYEVSDKEGVYKDLAEAFTIAESVYKTCSSKGGYAQAVVSPLENAVAIWEKALAQSNLSDKKARINYDITLKLYENIAIAHLFLGNYEAAFTNFSKEKNTERNAVTTNIKSHYSQVWERARQRMAGFTLNKSMLADADALKNAIVQAEKYRSMVTVKNLQNEYDNLNRDYAAFNNVEQNSDAQLSADVHSKAIQAGTENPYDGEVIYSAMQGYAFMKTPLMALGTKYDAIPVDVCKIERLNQILITNNNVATIPPEIGNLKNLKLLNLKKNKLTTIPEEICLLAALEQLDLGENQITKLPASIGKMQSLKSLSLKDNPIPEAEKSRIIAALPKCKVKF